MRIWVLALIGCVIGMNGMALAQDKAPILMGIDIDGKSNGLGTVVSRNGQYVGLIYMGASGGFGDTSVYKWSIDGAQLIARSSSQVQYLPSGISDDGRVFVYNASTMEISGLDYIVRWNNGVSTDIKTYDSLVGRYVSNLASGMTFDGSMMVGQAVKYVTPTSSYNQAAVFFADGRTHMLPVPLDPFTSLPSVGSAVSVSSNGSRIAGHANYMPMVWDDINAMPLDIGSGVLADGMAVAVSGDGKYVAGSGLGIGSTNYRDAFIWSDANGLRILDMPTNYIYTDAMNVTNSGQVMGVTRTVINNQIGDERAFLWTDAKGTRFLDDILVSEGTGMGEFVKLVAIVSASDDGNVITGAGMTFDGRVIPFILGLNGEVPGITTPGEIENSVNDMSLVGQQSQSMLSNHMNQSLFVARNALSSFLVPAKGMGASADELNDIQTASGPSEFRGHLDAREASAYVIGSFGIGQGGESGTDFDNHVYSGTAGILYKLNDDHVIGGGLLASRDKQKTYLDGHVAIKGYGLSGIYAYEPDMGLRFYAVVSALRLDMDTARRYRSGNTVAQSRGSTNGFAYGGVMRMGYAMYPWRNDQWQIMPYVEGEWSRVTLDGYREKRGSFPAKIAKQSGDSFIGRLGGQLTYYMNPNITLRGRAAWAHRYTNADDLRVSVANLSLSLPHSQGSRNWMEVGGTALWMMNDNAMMSFDVTGVTGRTAEPAVNMMLGIGYKF